jgi:hypothetical protein
MKSWKEKLLKNPAIEFQAFRFGPNATDNRIIMDAVEMRFLNPNINAFCIASTDSDYLFLAHRLRAHGKYVLGIGGANAKKEWCDSCNKFVKLENGNSHSKADKPEAPQDSSDAELTDSIVENSNSHSKADKPEAPQDSSGAELTDSIVNNGFDKAKSTGKTIDGSVLMADFAKIIRESYPGLWEQLGGNHRKALEDYANASGKIAIDKTKPGYYRIRLQSNSGGQTNNTAADKPEAPQDSSDAELTDSIVNDGFDKAKSTGKTDRKHLVLMTNRDQIIEKPSLSSLDVILEYGFNHAKLDENGWAYVSSFWEAIKKHYPSFKKHSKFLKQYGGTKAYELLKKYERETGKIELDKSKKGSLRIRQKSQERIPDNSEISAG